MLGLQGWGRGGGGVFGEGCEVLKDIQAIHVKPLQVRGAHMTMQKRRQAQQHHQAESQTAVELLPDALNHAAIVGLTSCKGERGQA